MSSTARLDDTCLKINLDWIGAIFGLSRRKFIVLRADIISLSSTSSKEARRMLRFRISGTAVPGWWLMGWFSRQTRDGRWAWVWITPNRDLVAIETKHRRRSLIIVPRDWFAEPPVLSG
ncbi:MAG: hypothetical protein EBQ64_06515 [Acidimicrobiia bacterium]|nr:hypothetical protein [Acidimicrobiia bacterium]